MDMDKVDFDCFGSVFSVQFRHALMSKPYEVWQKYGFRNE